MYVMSTGAFGPNRDDRVVYALEPDDGLTGANIFIGDGVCRISPRYDDVEVKIVSKPDGLEIEIDMTEAVPRP